MIIKNFCCIPFLNNNIEATNLFDKFDITFFAHIVNERFVSLSAIYLSKSILPSRPKRCSHKFCYKCIKLWSNEKRNYSLCVGENLSELSDSKE